MTGGPGSQHALRFVLSRYQPRVVSHWWRGMQTSGQSRQLVRRSALPPSSKLAGTHPVEMISFF